MRINMWESSLETAKTKQLIAASCNDYGTLNMIWRNIPSSTPSFTDKRKQTFQSLSGGQNSIQSTHDWKVRERENTYLSIITSPTIFNGILALKTVLENSLVLQKVYGQRDLENTIYMTLPSGNHNVFCLKGPEKSYHNIASAWSSSSQVFDQKNFILGFLFVKHLPEHQGIQFRGYHSWKP